MVRIKALIICLIGSSLFWGTAYGQLWQAVGKRLNYGHFSGIYTDTVNDRFFGFGYIQVPDSTGTGSPIGWHQVLELVNGQWTPIDTMNGAARVQDMIWYKGHYYACGPFEELGSSNQRNWAKYENGKWNNTSEKPNWSCAEMIVQDDTLFIGGSSDLFGIHYSPGIGKFDGTYFHGFSDTDTLGTKQVPLVNAIIKFQGNWIIGGNFDEGNHLHLYDDLVIYKDSKFQTPKNWQIGFQAQVYDLEIFQNELYVGGWFFKADGSSMGNNILKWDGEHWYELGLGCNNAVWDMQVFNDELIVAGWFSACDGVPANYIAKWNGERWCNFTAEAFNNTILDLGTYHDTLYIAGAFRYFGADSATYVAKWAGGDSSLQCGPVRQLFPIIGINELEDQEQALEIFPNPTNGKLIVKLSNDVEVIRYAVLDSQGSILIQKSIAEEEFEINLESMSPGLYFLRLEYEDSFEIQKVMKY